MTIEFRAPYVRLFYNCGKDLDRVWSIDFGKGSIEIQCASFVISDGCTIVSEISIEEPGSNKPKAWIEVRDAIIEINGNLVNVRPQC